MRFEVVPSKFKENLDKALFKKPYEYAVETAKQKALEVAKRMPFVSEVFATPSGLNPYLLFITICLQINFKAYTQWPLLVPLDPLFLPKPLQGWVVLAFREAILHTFIIWSRNMSAYCPRSLMNKTFVANAIDWMVCLFITQFSVNSKHRTVWKSRKHGCFYVPCIQSHKIACIWRLNCYNV